MAMAVAFATAVTSVVVLQSWHSAETSQAVTYNVTNWNADGEFFQDELWVVGDGSAYYNPHVISAPWNATSADFIGRLNPGYDKTGAVDGGACSGVWYNLAMGPLLIGEGDSRIAHLGWNSTGGNGGLVFSGDGNCYSVSDVTPSPYTGGSFDTTWGGEVNQKTGEVYLINAPAQVFDGDANDNNPLFNIVKVSTAASGSDDYVVTRLAASPATPPAAGAQTLAAAAIAAGKVPTSANPLTDNWLLGSDMAIDANGNAYRVARYSTSGANTPVDYWALIRFNIPRNQDGTPRSEGWTYNVVKIFDDAAVDNVWAMAFLNGALYTGHSSDEIMRWDTLSGANEGLGTFAPVLDFAAAQMAPVIEGRVYRDVNGDGVITDGTDSGLGGVVLEVWQERGSGVAPEFRGTLTTDSDGSYSALLPSASDSFYIRLRPTTVDGINAGQSYASAGSYQSGQSAANVVTPLCFSAEGNYRPLTSSGPCRGARADGIDPPTVTSPIATAGGANTVTKIEMNSDQAVVTADFGLSTGLSWGDAPDTYKTSNAGGGPYGAPDALYLGEKLEHYADGEPGPAASAHDASDDGLYFTPKRDDATYQASDWVLAQNQILVPGGQYRFRAKVSGAAAAAATAKAWLSPLDGGQAASTLADTILSGTPDANGYVYGDYTAATTAPANKLANIYARARVGQDSAFTSDSRGVGDPATSAWVPRGDIEDYRLAVANGVLRIKVRTLAGYAAWVGLGFDNVLDTAPSQTSFFILTQADGTFVRSPAPLAINDLSRMVAINALGVGQYGTGLLNGWKLLPSGSTCYDSTTGAVLNYHFSGGSMRMENLSAGATRDITCELTFGPSVSYLYSSLEVTPTPSADSPLAIGVDTYQVKVMGKNLINRAEGLPVVVPAAGEEVAIRVGPASPDPNLAGGASADGASFTVNSGQTYTCVLDEQGECFVTVQGTHRGHYIVSATGESGTQSVGSEDLYFAEGPPSSDESYASITQTADQLANHGAPGSVPGDWGRQTITVSVRDSLQQPVTNAAGALSVAAAATDPWSGEGLAFSNSGVFACSETPVEGACYSGDYEIVVYSARAGERQLVVTQGTGASAFAVKNISGSTTILRAPYTTPPVSSSDSTLIVTPSTPVDDPDSRTDVADGVPSSIDAGSAYTVVVTTWDAGRNNKVGGVPVTLELTGAECHASFSGGQTSVSGSTAASGDASALGRFTTTVSSDQVGLCTLTARLSSGQDAVAGSPKTLRWGDPTVNPGDPNTWFDVSADEVIADGNHFGTVTVSLYGTNGLPVTTVTDLAGSGPAGEGVTVGAFTHQGAGIYTATFSGTETGEKLIAVLQGALVISVKANTGNDTANLIPGPGSAEDSWLVQPTDSAVADGAHPITIGARVFDENGHPVDRGAVFFTIAADLNVGATPGPATIEASINADGWAEIQVTSRKATSVHGAYVVTATVGNTAITTVLDQAETSEVRRNGEVNPVFTAGDPDPLKSVLTVPTAVGGATKVADGQQEHRVQVLVRDSNDNPVEDVLVQFDYTCTGQAGYTCSGSWTGARTGADGIAYHDWSTVKVSTWTIAGLLGGVEVAGSPGSATFRPGPPVVGPGLTRLESPQTAARADGSDTQTALAYVTDAQGNAIPNANVTFTIPAGVTANGLTGPGSTTPVPTDADGIARLVAVSSLVGVYQVTASVATDAGPLAISQGSPAEIEFTNTQLDLANSVLTVTTAAALKTVRTEHHQVKADLVDTTGQPYQPATAVVFWYRLGASGDWTNGATLTTSAGIATWTAFTVAIAGTYQVRATVDGVQVGSVQEARFGPGPVDPATTLASLTVDSVPRANDGVAAVPATMKAQDADGNPVRGVTLNFELLYSGNGALFTSTAAKTASGVSGDDGLVRVDITSLYEGRFDVRGQIGADVSGQPYPQANFSVDVADPARSNFTVARTSTNASPTKAYADNADSYAATIVLRNAAGVAINGVGGTVYFTPKNIPGATEQSIPFIVGVGGAPQGTATVQLKTLKAGLWDVSVKIGADPVATTPGGATTAVEVEFEPGPIVHGADRSRLVSPAVAAKADDSDTQVVLAYVMDANQNPYKAADVVFTLPANVKFGTLTGAVTVRTDDQGIARIATTSTVVGEYDITAKVGSVQLTHGSPAKVRFTNADLSLANSRFTIPTAGVDQEVLTGRHTPKVELYDASGNLYLPATSVTFSYKLASASAWTAGATLPTAGGVVTWADFTVAVAGVYDVKAEIAAGQIGSLLQASFVHGPVDLTLTADSFWYSRGAQLSDDHARHSASVTVQDASANPISGEAVQFVLDPAKAAHFVDGVSGADLGKSVSVTSSDTGLARVWLTDGTPQTTHLTVTIGTDVVGEADFLFSTDAPSARNSSWVVTPASAQVADGVAAFTATVTVRDATQPTPLLVPDAEISFEVPAAVSIVEAGPYVTGADGQVTVHFTATDAGAYPVRALIGADGIAPDPTVINFEAGPISFEDGKTTLRGPGVTAVANGTARLGATATVRDAHENPVVDAIVEFAVPAGLTAKTASGDVAGPAVVEVAVDSVTAIAVLEYVTTTADSYQVTARAKKGENGTFGDIADGSPATLVFTHGTVSAATSVLAKDQPGPLTADGQQAYGVTVTLLDALGNAYNEANVPVRVTYTLGADVVEEDLRTDAAGVAHTSFATAVAGAWQATATVGGASVGVGSPLALVFEPGPADPTVSVFSTTTGNVLANGTAAHSAWVIVTDTQGNPVVGRTVAFTVATGASAVPGPVLTGGSAAAQAVSCDPAAPGAPSWCDQAGKALVYVTSNEPGSFAVAATLDGQAVNGSPRDVTFESGPADEVVSSYTITPLASADNTVAVAATGAAEDAYTVTVTARSVAQLLVPGAQVRLEGLDPSVAVSPSLAGFTGAPTSANFGTFSWRLTSTVAASFSGRVQLLTADGWQDVGDPFLARFRSGPPSANTSELVSPSAAARGNGEGVQAVQLILRDAHGNVASCWDQDVEVPCEVVFAIPGGTWVSQGLTRVSGPADVTIQAGLSRSAAGAGVAVVELYGDMGRWEVFAAVDGQPVTKADGVVSTDRSARPAVVRFTDAIPPAAPTLDPSNGEHVSGVVDEADQADAAAGDLIAVVVDPDSGDELARCPVEADGTFDCELPGLGDGAEIHVHIEDTARNASGEVAAVVDAVAPGEPVPGPSDGTEIGGKGREPGDTIIVTDEDGEELCRATVGEDLVWSCELVPPLHEGDMVTIVERDPAGNSTELAWRIGVPRVVLSEPALNRGARQTATGHNFQPGEEVAGVMRSDPLALGTATADADGKVVFTWTVPESAEFGSHEVTLTGPLSGAVAATFTVQALPFTGASGVVGALGLVFGLLVAGLLLLVAARRRRTPADQLG
ncbi:MAG: Ig-like domain-containing protein [Bifidobacteriaceae bacterium]|jgi:hypothetical protein|nr:Ig-like domain-containing protein [Bifidobacteriaceae bacterium]